MTGLPVMLLRALCLRVFHVVAAVFMLAASVYASAVTGDMDDHAHEHGGEPSSEQLVTEVTLDAPTIGLGKLSLDDLRTFVEVFDLLRTEQVAELDDKLLFDAAILGMLKNTDAQAVLYGKTGYQELLEFTEGGLADIGISVTYNQDGQWQIADVQPNSSAQSKGVAQGDVLLKVDGISLERYRLAIEAPAVEQLFWGKDGSWVSLTFTNQAGATSSVRIQRKKLVEDTVTFAEMDGILVAHIPSFTESTATQLDKRISSFSGRGVVLDLRGNPGGLLTSAVDVAGLFLDAKPVVELRYRGELKEVVHTKVGAPFTGVPLLVLVDEHTASAAEVLAVALLDAARAPVMGETTYGKGSVQKVWPLHDGRAVKFTVAYYYSPLGVKIDGRGVSPSVMPVTAPTTTSQRGLLQSSADNPSANVTNKLPNTKASAQELRKAVGQTAQPDPWLSAAIGFFAPLKSH